MAEADPQLIAHPYFAFGGKSAPCVNAANQAVPCAGAPLAYAGYPYGEDIVRIICCIGQSLTLSLSQQ